MSTQRTHPTLCILLQQVDARGANRKANPAACPSPEKWHRKAKAQGLTVAADLCSFVLGAGGASCAAEAEGGAAAPGGKNRAVLPVSWDPMQRSGAPRSALDTQPCKTGGWGEREKVLKGETPNLGRKGGRCWGLRPSRIKGLGQGGGSKQL